MRWRHGIYAVLTLAVGFSLGAFAYTGSALWALSGALLALASALYDAGEPQPGDPPKQRWTG
jgi:hypothetical protein